MSWLRRAFGWLGGGAREDKETDLVTVLGPTDRATLAIARSVLAEEGIHSLVPPTAPFRTLWGGAAQPMEYETLQVFRRDAARARAVLDSTFGRQQGRNRSHDSMT